PPAPALDPRTADGIHLVVESAKLAFADREAWYGDAVEPPVTALRDPAYTSHPRAPRSAAPAPPRPRGARGPGGPSLELRPGAPDGRPPRLPRFLSRDAAAP